MANTNAPFGFRQISGTGSAPTYEQVAVDIAYNTTNIFFGDPVAPTNTGYITQAGSSGGSSDTQIAGIFAGCQYLSTAQKRTVWSNYYPGGTDPASGTIIGYIINDPNAKFVAQTSSAGAAQTNINTTVGFTIGSGNTSTGISAALVNMSTSGTDNTQPFRILSLVSQPPGGPGTDTTSGYNYVVVGFNNVSTKSLVGI
jgi:hypothetical protein